jgi:hypothetical protein
MDDQKGSRTLLHDPDHGAEPAMPGAIVAVRCGMVDAHAAAAIEKKGVGAMEVVAEHSGEVVKIHRPFAGCKPDDAAFANADAASLRSTPDATHCR